MSSRLQSSSVILLLSLLLSTSSIGCGSLKTTVIHPIEKSDIFSVAKGESFTSEKDGWFLSDMYVEEVMKAKVQ